MHPAPPAVAARLAAASGLLAALIVGWVSRVRPLTPFAPGELDLVLAARAVAAGSPLPLWAGAVHPDEVGTWIEAWLLGGLLALGIPDAAALDLTGALHAAVFVGSFAGLAARLAGPGAGRRTAALLLVAMPSLITAFTRTTGTTAEAAGIEGLGLLGLLEARRRGRGAALLGALLGLGAVYSRHVAWLLLVAALAGPTTRWASRLRWAAVVGGSAAIVLALGELVRGAGGAETGLTVLATSPATLLGSLGLDDLAGLLAHLPFAAAHAPGAAGPLVWLHVPAVGLGLIALLAAAAGRGEGRWIALYAAGCGGAMLLAGDLVGWPAGYRYALNAAGPTLVLVGAMARWRRPIMACCGLWCVSSLLILPGAGRPELDRAAAAFFAGQHRVHVSTRRPVHAHAALLWPLLRSDEIGPFAQGYGLHLGREFAPVSRAAADAATRAPSTWVGAADALSPAVGVGLLRGVGLALGEDGRLDEEDRRLLAAAGDRDAVWAGIGGAVGERGTPLGGGCDGLAPVPFAQGVHETAAAGVLAAALLPTDCRPDVVAAAAAVARGLPRRWFALDRPLRYGGPVRPSPPEPLP